MKIVFSIFFLLIIQQTALAQTAPPYTSSNEITLILPGKQYEYSYSSSQLLFRFNELTKKLEMRVPLASFVPGNTGSPQVLFRELTLASSFPELIMTFEAPFDIFLSENLQPQNRDLKGVVLLQGITRDVATEIEFVPLNTTQLSLSTEFQFSIFGANVTLPPAYTDMVKGPVQVVIKNARWTNISPQSR